MIRAGLQQQHGGPCGVLCAIQAYALQHLLFPDAVNGPTKQSYTEAELTAKMASWSSDEATSKESFLPFIACLDSVATDALIHAITHMLFQASPTTPPQATVVMSMSLPLERATTGENFLLQTFTSHEACHDYIRDQFEAFRTPSGVLLFVYSLLLSRTLPQVARDMDEEGSPLVARFGHCTQELLNLCLLGLATPHCFDG